MSTHVGTQPSQSQSLRHTRSATFSGFKPRPLNSETRKKLEELGQLCFFGTISDAELSVLRESPGEQMPKPERTVTKRTSADTPEQLALLFELIDRQIDKLDLPPWNETDLTVMHELLLIRSCKQLANWRTTAETRAEIIDWIRDTEQRPFSFWACCAVIPVNSDEFRDQLLYFIHSPKAITLTDSVKFEALLRRRMEEAREAA